MTQSTVQLDELGRRIEETWLLLKLDEKQATLKQLEEQMQASDFWQDQTRATEISQRHERLRAEIERWQSLRTEVSELALLEAELEKQPDDDLRAEARKRAAELEKQFSKLEFFVLLNGKYDDHTALVTITAGSGGTEAQDWAEMLLRMIVRFAEKKDWTATLLDESKGTEAGIKSASLRVEGPYAYGLLQSEHGTHRLVRISPFDAESMRHTSFASIEVIPEIEHTELKINEADLRIDTFMAGGHGGQSVNTTYSAVRIVHIPTGISVQCQNEKSQLQNKQAAMKILVSRLQKRKEEEEEAERLHLRGAYKPAEWGSQIRSYVLHPYKMVKDLRSGYETTEPDKVLDGELDALVEAYLKWKRQNRAE